MLTDKQRLTSALCGHWMQFRGPIRRERESEREWKQGNSGCSLEDHKDIYIYIYIERERESERERERERARELWCPYDLMMMMMMMMIYFLVKYIVLNILKYPPSLPHHPQQYHHHKIMLTLSLSLSLDSLSPSIPIIHWSWKFLCTTYNVCKEQMYVSPC